MTFSQASRDALERLRDADGWTPRLETWALAIPDREESVGRAVMVVGVDPERETAVSRLGGSLQAGRFLDGGRDREVVLGARLARNLGVELGEQVILFSSDYYGSQAAARFTVIGTLEVGDSRFDASAALTRLDQLQSFLDFPGGLSHVAVFASDGERAEAIRADLENVFAPDSYEVLAWPELVPEIVQALLLDDIGNYLTLAILITVAGFGILNTILMSVFERVREFGVMRAMGVRPRGIFALVLIESAILSVIGIGIGVAAAVPLILWLEQQPIPITSETGALAIELFQVEPVIASAMRATHLTFTPLIVLSVALMAALPPAFRAARGRPVDALREF
jgi:ABC-type lipoprotein release transport system permease subunit